VDLCPLIEQKTKKFGGFLEKLGFGECWKKKREIGDFGGRRWSFGGGEGGCRRWVWVIFGFKEERDRGAVSGCTAGGKKMGMRKKNLT
jgi:hypothetical protein